MSIYLVKPGLTQRWKLNDEQHAEIEEKIMERIRQRVNSQVSPDYRRAAYLTVCKLVGIKHPNDALFRTTQEIVDWRRTVLEDNALLGQTKNYNAIQVWAILLADAAEFSKERLEMIAAACMPKPRIVANNDGKDAPRTKTAHPKKTKGAPLLRRVV